MTQELDELFPIRDIGLTPIKAFEKLCTFAERWGKSYRSFLSLSSPRNIGYFTYLRFPTWVEGLNRSSKRTLRMRGAIPSADAGVFLLGSVAREMTERTYARRLPYFQERSIK